MRVAWLLAAGLLLCVGIVACLIWLANAFDTVSFSYYGSPTDGCVTVPDSVKAELDRLSHRPLNALLVVTTGSAIAFGIEALRRTPGRPGRLTLGALVLAGAAGSLLSRPMYAADDFTALAIIGIGLTASIGAWLVLLAGPRVSVHSE